ncbi:MAG: glycosyl hydrolase 108 family protein [Hyphomicrobium sp.]|nr:hypothetical protein [Hyphomicrobium sp.]
MKHNFIIALHNILRSEGFYDGKRGWTNDPEDSGGPTLAGITYNNYCEYIGEPGLCRPKNDRNWDPAIVRALRNITDDQISDFYRTKKWSVVRGDDLPPGIDLAVVDVCTLHGLGKARSFYRQALALPESMRPFSDEELRAVWDTSVDWDHVIEAIAGLRRKHYYAIITKYPGKRKFLKGWLNRTRTVTAQCCELAPDRSGETMLTLADHGRCDDPEEPAIAA